MTVFDDIYRENRWNGDESRSGPGSGTPATRHVAAEIVTLVAELDIRSVLDFGCGDGFWMPELPGYYGMDWSREAIRRARRNHPDRSYGTTLPYQPFDLVVVRDVIQHLPLADGKASIETLRLVARWMLVSTYAGGQNVDVEPGGAYSPDMTAAPFAMPEPERMIFDGYHYHDHDTDQVRDSRKHLGLWRVR